MSLRRRIKYHYNQGLKSIILNVFYRNHYTREHYNLPSSQLIAIFLFQKIIGINRHISFPVHFTNFIGRTGTFEVDKTSYLSFAANGGMYIQTINGIHLGKNILIASGTKIISANHNTSNLSKHFESSPIRIGDHCWLGSNVVVLPGVQLGDHIVVGAGSVVTKNFKNGSIVVGVPARPLKNR